jgi:hypothetical protein
MLWGRGHGKGQETWFWSEGSSGGRVIFSEACD